MAKKDDLQPAPVSIVVDEFEFPTHLFGRLRHFIHGIAGRWAVRYVIQQQNLINLEQNLTSNRLKQGLLSVDQDVVETRKQLAELMMLVAQQQKKIAQLEAKLDQVEG